MSTNRRSLLFGYFWYVVFLLAVGVTVTVSPFWRDQILVTFKNVCSFTVGDITVIANHPVGYHEQFSVLVIYLTFSSLPFMVIRAARRFKLDSAEEMSMTDFNELLRDWILDDEPLARIGTAAVLGLLKYGALAVFEEFLFRYIGIGILPKWIPSVPLYTWILISTASFGVLHIFKTQGGVRVYPLWPLRIVVTMIAGFAFAYLFIKYGFWSALFVHMATNVIIVLFSFVPLFVYQLYRRYEEIA
ncbi:hypothetical protein A3H75_00660 [Candidatus Uhrbacteria bacterium RIFCSPLOWO2_02_FULL_51_9]|uniref:CAAX prenyl protease 2/Lysostaphin resistance protein A-like domain-containing protein n=1 Tax=Candidatus Uhrbacteria bacterium RIFCSPLOWO2_02_FULL_51_9 TaxID=1802410 RepID=A0A1F7VG10_9BACT|nr:MAG: hypothetical protein A3H75_00660 [Candidatus Uhrbacteria bacterium RIFCSPLOWO2_02_FULL_51_9]